MKKISIAVVALLLLAGVLSYASPYRAVRGIRAAAKAGDGEQLSAYVDYPALRENLKDQLRTGVSSYLAGDEENPFAALSSALAGTVTDKLVDSYVTPEGVTDLLGGRKERRADRRDRPGGDSGENDDDGKPLRDVRVRFRSLSEVEVAARDRQDRDVTFVLTRQALTWKLTNIILPLDLER